MNVLTMEQVTKSFGFNTLLDHIDFSVNEGEKVGVIGINGTGKSTLLRILAGAEECDDGSVTMQNNLKIGYLTQNPVFDENHTVLEACVAGIGEEDDRWGLEADAKSMLLEFAITDFDQPVNELSGGQKKKAALVHVLLMKADLLVLDEPTNHLDSEMASWLEDYLIRFKGAIVLVTHDRFFLDRIATRIVEIDKGKVYSYPGNYSAFVSLKAERESMAQSTALKKANILRNELKWLMRGARARSTKQKAHIQRIEALKEWKAPTQDGTVVMSSLSSRMGKKTIELDHLSKKYGDKVLFDDFSYIFLKNDRIGIIGRNGCGKSTLMKVITGQVAPDAGTVEIGSTIKIAYFSQENEALDESLKAIEYVREGAEYIRTKDGVITASAMLERFLFEGEKQWSYISKMSGGEKRRLYLLRLLMEAPNVLILDEPTNDLDIRTLQVLEDYLDEFDGIVITVSHDRYFLDRVVRRIFAFEDGGHLRQYEGGYSDYDLARCAQEDEAYMKTSGNTGEKAVLPASGEDVPSNPVGKKPPREKKLKLTFKEQREWETIDDDMAALEDKIAQIDKDMLKFTSNFVKLNELTKLKEETQASLDEKMDRWVYLSELVEKIEQEKEG